MNKLGISCILGIAVLIAASIVPVYAPVSKTDCPPNVSSGTFKMVIVNGSCVKTSSEMLTADVKLDEADDQFNHDAGILVGDIKCENAGTGAGLTYAVAVGTGASMTGSVKAENCGPVVTGGSTTINGDVKVENGDVTIASGTTVTGDVKHDGTGTCTVNGTVNGEIKGC